MACTCTGFEIFTALNNDGLVKTIQSLDPGTLLDTSLLPMQEPVLGVNGSKNITGLDISNYVLTKLSNESEAIFEPDADSDYECYRTQNIGNSAGANFTFKVPDDFIAVIELYIIGVPISAGAAGPGKSITINSCYGGIGESSTIHQQSPTLNVDTGTLDNFFKLDLTTAFDTPGIAAGDSCGFEISHNGVGGTIAYLNTILRYQRSL